MNIGDIVYSWISRHVCCNIHRHLIKRRGIVKRTIINCELFLLFRIFRFLLFRMIHFSQTLRSHQLKQILSIVVILKLWIKYFQAHLKANYIVLLIFFQFWADIKLISVLVVLSLRQIDLFLFSIDSYGTAVELIWKFLRKII